MKIDKMFFNGNIITLDNSNTIVDSLALNSGKIVKLGKKDDLMKLVDEDTQLMENNNKKVQKTSKVLTAIERVGNKFPHPAALFLYLYLYLWN